MKARRKPFFASLFVGALLCLGLVPPGAHTKQLERPSSGDSGIAYYSGITLADVARTRSRFFADATDTIKIQRRDRSISGRFKEFYSSLALSLWQQTGERSQFLFDSALQFCPPSVEIISSAPATDRTTLCALVLLI